MLTTRSRARKGKEPVIEPESQTEKGESSKRTRTSGSGRQNPRTRQRRVETSPDPQEERGNNQEPLMTDQITAAIEKAMQQWATQAAGLIQGMWEGQRQHPPQNSERPGLAINPHIIREAEENLLEADRKAINAFLLHRPPKFAGEPDPVIAEQWVMEIKRLFKVSPCTEQQKVLCATHLLIKDAYEWWETLQQTMP